MFGKMALGKDEVRSESFSNYVKRKLKCFGKLLSKLGQEETEIIPESEGEYCGICLSTKKKSEMFRTCNSDHSYCTGCVARYVCIKIKEKRAWIKCPHFSCKQFLTPQEFSLVLPHSIVEWWEGALDKAYKKMRREIRCPFKNCSAVVMTVYDGGGPQVGVTNQSSGDKCPRCKRRLCKTCHRPRHDGSKCDMDKMFRDLAQRENWRPCPNCNIYVERTGGCTLMRCRLIFHFF